MVCGSSGSLRPWRFFQSLAVPPAARTAIRTWPGPGCGSGRSTISRTSGPPKWLKRTAFIMRSDLGPEAVLAGCATNDLSRGVGADALGDVGIAAGRSIRTLFYHGMVFLTNEHCLP